MLIILIKKIIVINYFNFDEKLFCLKNLRKKLKFKKSAKLI